MGGGHITGHEQTTCRLELARIFLEEARQDARLQRWHSAVDGAQLAFENAGQAALALAGLLGRTHNPAVQIRHLIGEGGFDAAGARASCGACELLGPDIHVRTDYGDEAEGRTPWELFGEQDARQALTVADEAVGISGRIVREGSRG